MDAKPAPAKPPARKKRRHEAKPTVIGWREMVDLPDLGIADLRAKIDTGARTSAFHASRIRIVERDGRSLVEFTPDRTGRKRQARLSLPLEDEREITNTGGQPELRAIIRTHLAIAGKLFLIDLSLTDRSGMTYPIIVGRTAIRRHGLLVDSGRSWLTRPHPDARKG